MFFKGLLTFPSFSNIVQVVPPLQFQLIHSSRNNFFFFNFFGLFQLIFCHSTQLEIILKNGYVLTLFQKNMIKARKIGSFLILFFKSFSNLQNGSIGKGFAYLACTNAVMVFVGAVLVVVSLFAPIELSKMFISFKTIFQLSSIISKNHNFERNICTVMSNNQRTTREINTKRGVPSHHTPPKHPTSTKPPLHAKTTTTHKNS